MRESNLLLFIVPWYWRWDIRFCLFFTGSLLLLGLRSWCLPLWHTQVFSYHCLLSWIHEKILMHLSTSDVSTVLIIHRHLKVFEHSCISLPRKLWLFSSPHIGLLGCLSFRFFCFSLCIFLLAQFCLPDLSLFLCMSLSLNRRIQLLLPVFLFLSPLLS